MDPVILLFRLVAKITTSEGAISRPYLHLNPAQGANIRGFSPASFDGFQHAIFVLEVLLSAILGVYASIALAYAVRYYKKLWHSPDHRIRAKSPRCQYNPRDIGYHVV